MVRKLARHETRKYESKYFYTNCKKKNHVKITRKLEEEEEASLHLIVTDQLQNTYSLYFLV